MRRPGCWSNPRVASTVAATCMHLCVAPGVVAADVAGGVRGGAEGPGAQGDDCVSTSCCSTRSTRSTYHCAWLYRSSAPGTPDVEPAPLAHRYRAAVKTESAGESGSVRPSPPPSTAKPRRLAAISCSGPTAPAELGPTSRPCPL